MTWNVLKSKAAGWLAKFMHVPDYNSLGEALDAQGVHCENPVGMGDSISLELTKGDPDDTPGERPASHEALDAYHAAQEEATQAPAACEWRPHTPDSDTAPDHNN
jgi:hypothetical protein